MVHDVVEAVPFWWACVFVFPQASPHVRVCTCERVGTPCPPVRGEHKHFGVCCVGVGVGVDVGRVGLIGRSA
eukprot:277243-Pelagomonas_calceolata.AAC.1